MSDPFVASRVTRTGHALLVSTFLSIFLLVQPGPADAQKLRVAWTAVSALNAPYWIMKDAGFFKQEGLDVDLVYIPSSTVVASAMLAGEAAISTANSQVVNHISVIDITGGSQ